jgi:hypothetical protein
MKTKYGGKMKIVRCFPAASLAILLFISTVHGAGIKVTAPNGGERWMLGSQHAITWTAQDIKGNVQIVLTRAKLNVRVIHSFTADIKGIKMGRFDWTIPRDLPTGTNFKIKILCRMGKAVVADESDKNFTLDRMTMEAKAPELPRVRVLSPNGGETIRHGQSILIRWWSNVDFAGANIDFDKEDTGTIRRITVMRADGPAADGSYSYSFTIPADFPTGGDYRVRIWGYGGRASDRSDAPFTIGTTGASGASLVVTCPKSGGVR